MKINKLFLTLLTIAILGSMHSEISARRGGGYGHRGYHGGGYRHHGYHGGWGRGYYGGWGWGIPAATIGFGLGVGNYWNRDPQVTIVNTESRPADYRDAMGRTYWDITNSTSIPLEIRAVGNDYSNAQPGSRIQIPRINNSFRITVQGPNRQRLSFSTRDHYVEITQYSNGRLGYRSWNE